MRIDGGRKNVRAVQRWPNGSYINRHNFFVIPCDGYFSRDAQKALLLAIQFEIGMSDDVANGVFGPGTQQGIRNNLLSVGSSGRWVLLFTASMCCHVRRPTSELYRLTQLMHTRLAVGGRPAPSRRPGRSSVTVHRVPNM